ncbi:MAG TPA: sugar phosphate nucleotidyltransferase [Myxococcales bacterium]|nr:sugar phosphate nucleotidyltransferase [Myxococcales bacterium]
MQVVVLAGGLGTRLGTLTTALPKALVPVNGKPFFEHVIALLKEHGLSRLLLLHGHHGDQLETLLGDGGRFGISIGYRHDGPLLLGTGGALRNAIDLLEEDFFLLYGDTFLDIDYGAVERAHRASGKPALMTVFRNSGQFDTSNVVFRDGALLRYDKTARAPEMDYIDYGLAALRREVIAEIPPGVPQDLAALYSRLVREGRMEGYEVFRRFYEVGTPEGLAQTARYLGQR